MREEKAMDNGKIIGYTELFDKINAIVVKNGTIEIQETSIKKSDYC